jgi:hypothetical protein
MKIKRVSYISRRNKPDERRTSPNAKILSWRIRRIGHNWNRLNKSKKMLSQLKKRHWCLRRVRSSWKLTAKNLVLKLADKIFKDFVWNVWNACPT